MSDKPFASLLSTDDLSFWRNDNPKCPHCGHDCIVSDMEAWHLYEEGEHELECPSCDGSFMVSTNVTFTFSTDEQDIED